MSARLEATQDNRTVLLDKPIIFVGRHPECDMVINGSRKISRKHCCFAEINGAFQVRDLGSMNGVQVNGKRISGLRPLNPGDRVTIGDCEFHFLTGIPRAAAPHPQDAKPTPPLSDEGAGYRSDDFSSTDHRELVDHEESSEIPIMLNESDEDGFEVRGGSSQSVEQSRRSNNSDSHA